MLTAEELIVQLLAWIREQVRHLMTEVLAMKSKGTLTIAAFAGMLVVSGSLAISA